MRKVLFFATSLIAFIAVKAEDNNPYAQFGYTPKNEYVIANKKKLEIKNIDTSAQAFMLYFDFDTKRVCLKDKNGVLLMAKDIPADVVAKWISVDPKASERAGLTPYNFVQNSPLIRIDPDGQLDFQCNDDELQANNLTSDDITRFKSVVDNLSSTIKDNTRLLDLISKETGYDQAKILSDLQANNGPKVLIDPSKSMTGRSDGVIYVGADLIRAFAKIDPNDKTNLAQQTLGFAISFLHEYIHIGDQANNNGMNSGEWYRDANNKPTPMSTITSTHIPYGTAKDQTPQSRTGERGKDLEFMGFGVNLDYNDNNTFSIIPAKQVDIRFPIPMGSIPFNMQGTTILKVLKVE